MLQNVQLHREVTKAWKEHGEDLQGGAADCNGTPLCSANLRLSLILSSKRHELPRIRSSNPAVSI